MTNLLIYSIQLAAVVVAAAFIRPLMVIRVPNGKLLFWQSTLAVCLLMPIAHPWKQNLTKGAVTVTTTVLATARTTRATSLHVSWTDAIAIMLFAGIAARLTWLAIGLLRLRRLRLNSEPLYSDDVRISPEVKSPVTFGFLRPVILLPSSFPQLERPIREAILCHECLHIERRDWLFTVAEELIRAALWFHPAIWWILSEIQLAREQVIDEAVICATSMRESYVDALLSIAGAAQPDLAPAPLFLRKRHLKHRVISILKEVRMSKSRTYSGLAAGLAVMAGLSWFISGAIPLIAQTPADAVGVTVDTGGAELMHRTGIVYPPGAMKDHIEGIVVVTATLGPTGAVREATVISGPDELRAAAVSSIRNWHFVREAAPVQQITITFHIPSESGVTIKEIMIAGLSPRAKEQLLAQLPVHEGDPLTPELMTQVNQAAAAFDEHLHAATNRTSDTGATLIISPSPAGPIRVGGLVAQANLLTKVPPLYPADAKAARIQGTVQLEVTISPEGQIRNIRVLSGPPALIQSALNAVKQWAYKPTLLNGQPIEVLTTVDVNYTLSQ